MSMQNAKKLISILMESSLYLILPLSERRTLLEQMALDYPFLLDGGAEQKEAVGYEASLAGIFRTF